MPLAFAHAGVNPLRRDPTFCLAKPVAWPQALRNPKLDDRTMTPMRAVTLALALALLAPTAHAETLSQEIGRTGIAPTEARLAALPTPTNEELFALAGLR